MLTQLKKMLAHPRKHAHAHQPSPAHVSMSMIFVLLFMQYKVPPVQYKSLITFFRGWGVKASPRTALLLSKTIIKGQSKGNADI
jgi:hypothetical protein